ncbi:calcium channel subunit mid1 [Grosmannia clavigera kw1407]|uniref:Calcium channel subunit mid1 n=1 Tax=Grosmannia clavigera (strain kw1407 / UAMH 11150) TaxID=655863 RepID=F0XM73_GROCL|nr:calcium channel subunit mid1 [Grosmannia clavigera kw1407]EFX01426.1 calcium channel subunit mid1 [Grosmannia clavigera kw1407]
MLSTSRMAALVALLLSLPRMTATVAADSDSLIARLLHGDFSVDSNTLPSLHLDAEQQHDDSDAEGNTYLSSFSAFARSLMGRAPAGVESLTSNVATQLNVVAGSTQVFVYEVPSNSKKNKGKKDEAGELRRREDGDAEVEGSDGVAVERSGTVEFVASEHNKTSRIVYLSANTCIQPQPVANVSRVPGANSSVEAPQLTMYVSTSSANTSPGPKANANEQTWQTFTEGAVMLSVNTTGDVYIGISAPNVSSTQMTGIYNFEVAASVDEFYHSYDNQSDANLIWVDSDAYASLLITHNLTDSTDVATDDSVMERPPYVMFAQNANDSSINGVRLSYCGLQTYAQIAATKNGKFTSIVTTSMTRRGQGNLPKQQFYFSGLNASTDYIGILAELPNNGTEQAGTSGVAGGGGHISRATSFSTKAANGNCEVVFNLTFCNETAYAVPSNPTRFANASLLAQEYDQYASDMFAVFEKVLAQIPCEAPSTQRYSLARNCTHCSAAYKNWLCSVAIPRCADFSETEAWLQPRAISGSFPNGTYLDPAMASLYPNSSAYNSSRNPFIDSNVAPGPYKEVLPCEDLCYNLAQSCPASLGLSCPTRSSYGFNTSYGLRTGADNNGAVTCNYPGSAHFYSAAPSGPRLPWLAFALAVLGFVMI